ncbi:MAG: hypothetical protein LBJ26_16375 [Paenibacillus sp.]|nr:hypothetical protein [Paenibacillus sp.]
MFFLALLTYIKKK